MACDRADRVTAIAAISGVTFAEPARCAPSAPVAILQIHGTDDDTIRFQGGVLQVPGMPDAPYPGALETADLWLGLDGCDAALTETTRRIDAVADVDGADGSAETTVAGSTGVRPGRRRRALDDGRRRARPRILEGVSRRGPGLPAGAAAALTGRPGSAWSPRIPFRNCDVAR